MPCTSGKGKTPASKGTYLLLFQGSSSTTTPLLWTQLLSPFSFRTVTAAATVHPCPAMLRAAWCHRQLKNECQTPQLAFPAPSVSPLLPTSFHMLNVCKTCSLSMWVTDLKLMPTSPIHKFKPLYTRPTFFPICLLVSFFLNIWFLGFGALFLHAEKVLWMFWNRF